MALAAQLYRDDRAAERFRVEFDATLRDSSFLPLDVVIEDLSATGFRVVTEACLDEGAEVGLGLAGIGTHRARVVWQRDNTYGCEFLAPLHRADLALALSSPSTAPVPLPTPWGTPLPTQQTNTGLSPRARLFAIVACAAAAWAVTIGLAAAIGYTMALVH